MVDAASRNSILKSCFLLNQCKKNEKVIFRRYISTEFSSLNNNPNFIIYDIRKKRFFSLDTCVRSTTLLNVFV